MTQVRVEQDADGIRAYDTEDGRLMGETKWFAKVDTRLGELVQYPPPAFHPDCQCRDNPIRAFFCTSGHLVECHYPNNCATARCMHLLRYDE